MKIVTRLLLFATVVALSCNSQNSDKGQNSISVHTYEFQPIDTVFVPIDSTVSNFFPVFQYFEHQESFWFVTYSNTSHSIIFYDLLSKTETFRTLLNNDGPNPIPALQGFLVHNWDSIFLFSLISNEIFLINRNGIIQDYYVIDEKLSNGPDSYEIQVGDFFIPSFNFPSLSFWIAPFIDRTKGEFYKYPLAIDFDVKRKKVKRYYGNYPKTYVAGSTYFLLEDLGRLSTEAYDIHYFLGSHKIFLYDKNDKSFSKEIFAKSAHLPDNILPGMTTGVVEPGRQQQANYYIQTGRYSVMRYDKRNKLNYRFVRHPQELKMPSGLLNGKITSSYSVMILDSTFAVAGEYSLPANRFLELTSFVSDGLLWVSANHPKSPINREDYLIFVRFKPVQQ
jgi:hypothetical protein